MTIDSIFAQLNCSDIEKSRSWFEALFGRAPDVYPMDGLVEWHHQGSGGFQLFVNPQDAGHGTLTLIVRDLTAERQRLVEAGHEPSEIETGDVASIMQLSDPDGNTVVFAEPAA